jgi:hypothetical protein
VGGGSVNLFFVADNGKVSSAVVAQGQSYNYTDKLVSVSWNFSSALNLTRTIEFLPYDGSVGGQQVFPIYTASPDFVMGVYVFNVVDYTGSAQWVEVRVGGTVIERRSITLSGAADFTLFKSAYYTVSVVGSLGVFSQSFVAGNVYSSNIIVLADSFGEASTNGYNTVFYARRNEEGAVHVFFNDHLRRGVFEFRISEVRGKDVVVLYSSGVVDHVYFPYSFIWFNAEPGVVYTVDAFHFGDDGGLLRSWVVSVSSVNGGGKGNPFVELLAPFGLSIDTLPGSAVLPTGFDVAQLPVAGLLGLVLAIFSFSNHGKGCLLCWVVAAVMVGLGWFVVSLPAFGFALFLSVLIVFTEGKRTEREL